MRRELATVAVMPETKELVGKIADVTNEKKIAIFDRAIRDYARKNNIIVACGK